MGRKKRVAVIPVISGDLASISGTVTTFTEPIADVPHIEKHFNGEDMDNGKRIILRDSSGTPLLPVSADYIELVDMYSELAKRVFYLEARIRELEEARDGNNKYKRFGNETIPYCIDTPLS